MGSNPTPSATMDDMGAHKQCAPFLLLINSSSRINAYIIDMMHGDGLEHNRLITLKEVRSMPKCFLGYKRLGLLWKDLPRWRRKRWHRENQTRQSRGLPPLKKLYA